MRISTKSAQLNVKIQRNSVYIFIVIASSSQFGNTRIFSRIVTPISLCWSILDIESAFFSIVIHGLRMWRRSWVTTFSLSFSISRQPNASKLCASWIDQTVASSLWYKMGYQYHTLLNFWCGLLVSFNVYLSFFFLNLISNLILQLVTQERT